MGKNDNTTVLVTNLSHSHTRYTSSRLSHRNSNYWKENPLSSIRMTTAAILNIYINYVNY